MACAALLVGSPAAARVDVDARIVPAFFTGEFGSDVRTDITYIPLILRLSSARQEFRLTAPYLSIRTEEPVTFAGGDVIRRGTGGTTTESGAGDLVLQEDLFFLQGGGRRPWVSGSFRVKLPTADETQGLGTGELDYGPGVGLIQPLGSRWSILASVQYVVRGDPPGTDLRNTRWLSAGTQVRLGRGASVNLFYENRQSVLRGRDDIQDVSLGYDQRLSDTVTFRSILFLG
ncbi:MAG: transporter, partial [Planctomycetota bacterium]